MSERSGEAPDPARVLWMLWRQGLAPDVRDFLDDFGDLDPGQLAATLRVDQRERWQAGERVAAAAYLHDFPAVAADPEAALELVYGEFLLREELGERPAAEDYLRDYPGLADRLELQLEVYRALGAGWDHGSESTSVASPAAVFRPSPGGGGSGLPLAPEGYEILGVLGRGGMGVVYKARQLRLNRIVALKTIRADDLAGPDERIRFLQEAEIVARLAHPNIVQIFGIGECDGRTFLELEYVGGGTLADRLDGTPQPAEAAARLVETLARAAHLAHLRGVIHRDLKPANVLLTPDGTPKISDFGLAKVIMAGAGGPLVSLTQTGAVLGTPAYMAPEQSGGRPGAVGPAADVHSLGVILYELLTGRGPFRGASPMETLEQVRFQEPVPPRFLRPKLARDLEVICLKCLQKDPARRYASALDLADDLARHLRGEPIVARGVHAFGRLADALERGHHDREFRAWGDIVLVLTAVCALPHVVVFACALAAPPRWLLYTFPLPVVVFAATLFVLARANRSYVRMPTSPAVRQAGAMLVALFLTSNLMNLVVWMLGMLTGPRAGLGLYPLHSLLAGQMFFGMGGGYWGRLYLGGVAFFATALLMTRNVVWAPLEFAVVIVVVFGAIGLRLRRLGHDAADVLDRPSGGG